MAETDGSEMIRDAEAVVEQALCLLLGVEDVGAQIEAFEWELDECVNFLTASKSISISRRLESLETDNQYSRHSVDLESLSGLDKLLTLIAVPLVVLIENF